MPWQLLLTIPAAEQTQSIETIIIIFLSEQRTRVRTEVTKINGHKKKNKKQRDGQQQNKTSLKLKEWRTINLEGKE